LARTARPIPITAASCQRRRLNRRGSAPSTKAGVADRIDVRTGDALELLSEEKGQFDIIFCDIDKDDYPRALKLAAPRVRKGGLLVTDNTLWHGRVVAPAGSEDAEMATTRAIKEFNTALYGLSDFFTTLLPLRDGVSVALKH